MLNHYFNIEGYQTVPSTNKNSSNRKREKIWKNNLSTSPNFTIKRREQLSGKLCSTDILLVSYRIRMGAI